MSDVRWARFRDPQGRIGFGQVQGDEIREFAGDLFAAPTATGAVIALGAVQLLAPCVPSKIVALWNNFHALAAKLGKPAPSHPLFLLKPTSCVIGPEEPIRRPTSYAGKIVFEGELGIVIGRRSKDVSLAAARSHIFGYTCVNDVTAADVLNESPDFAQWCRAKSFDTFGCLGPVIATDLDLAGASVVTRLGDSERQNYPLADMIMRPEELVSRLSHDLTLLPGDVIACGTSLGVGSIRDGVSVEVTIGGIGSLTNTLVGIA
jgi:2-keto-4-pentenoate hydratase/2-oxohepta-3-ene-1,7-dioic acid hydratase in catechol pathway